MINKMENSGCFGLAVLLLFCWTQVDASDYFNKHRLRAKLAKPDMEATATARILIPDDNEENLLNSRYMVKPTVPISVVRKKRNKMLLRKKPKVEKSGSKRALPYDNPHPSETQFKKTVKTDKASNKQTIPNNNIRTINTNTNNNPAVNNAATVSVANNAVNVNNAAVANPANNAASNTSLNSVDNGGDNGAAAGSNDLSNNDDALGEGNADIENNANDDDSFDNNEPDDSDEEDDEELSPTDSPDDDESPTDAKVSSEASADGASNTDDATNLQAPEDTTNLDFDDDNDAETDDEEASPTDTPDGEKKTLILKKNTSANQHKRETKKNSTENVDDVLNAKNYSELMKLEQDINVIAGDISKKRSVISVAKDYGNS